MAVYVDPLFDHWKRNREGYQWCHMQADSLDELHAFAAAIGRNRCWFHRGDHYDLTPSFRAKAVAAGAIELRAIDSSLMAINARRARKGLPPLPKR